MQNKEQFLKTIAAKGNISTREAGKCLDLVLDSLKDALAKDGGVALTGILRASLETKEAKTGVMNGKEWSKPEHKVVKVKVSETFVKKIEQA